VKRTAATATAENRDTTNEKGKNRLVHTNTATNELCLWYDAEFFAGDFSRNPQPPD
jgi:hypothetical protein